MTNDLTLDDRIDKAHAALEQAEYEALQLIERIARIPGTAGFLGRKRSYGVAPNPWSGSGNLSLQMTIQKADPALARYLAGLAGKAVAAPDYKAAQAQERAAANRESMQAETARLREKNQQLLQRQRDQATYGRWTPNGLRVS